MRRTSNWRASLAVALLLATMSMSPVIQSTDAGTLQAPSHHLQTSNNSIDDSTAQTLLSSLNASNDSELSGVIDDMGRFHLSWVDTGAPTYLLYAMFDSNGSILISPTPIPTNSSSLASSPSMVMDSQSFLHVVWESTGTEIRYALIDPSNDDMDGDSGQMANMTLVPSTVIADGSGQRSDPDIAIDSYDAAHIVWIDTYDPLGLYYNSPLVYYTMVAYDNSSSAWSPLSTLIGQTLVTTSLSTTGSPAISVGANNTVVIVWHDTRGSMIEYVGILDTSGSMNAEWADMCTVFYGGFYTSGGSFPGIKPLLLQSNITVMETLYALSGNWPSAAQSGNCADAYQTGGSGSQGPRTTALDSDDDSGGIRFLTDVVFNNASTNLPQDGGYYSEFWGPGTTWACLSWVDWGDNSPGNPPTTLDHQWNSTATKVVIPVSDEGPFGGDPSQQADDTQSINEAHDACVHAGITPVPLVAAGFGSASTDVGSHMMDLAACPNGFVSLNTRACDGSTMRLTHAGGQMFTFPSSSNSADLDLMVEYIVSLASGGGATEVFMTVLDPYSFFNNPRGGWSLGDPGHETDYSNNRYTEYVGPSMDPLGYGNLVIANDTRLTFDAGWSTSPDVTLDNRGNAHITWIDGREADTNNASAPSQLHYMQVDLDRNGSLQGEIDLNATTTVVDTAMQHSNLTWGASPRVDTDTDGSVYLSWFETEDDRVDLRMTRMRAPDLQNGQLPLGLTADEAYLSIQTQHIASGNSGLMGIASGDSAGGTQPIVRFDWPERFLLWTSDDCETSDYDGNTQTELCLFYESDYSMQLAVNQGEAESVVIRPGFTALVGMTLTGISIPDVYDIVAFEMSGVPSDWDTAVGYTTSYQSTATLIQGGQIPVYLFLRAPSLWEVDENQSFDLIVTARSTTMQSATTSLLVHVDMINEGDWNDDDGDGVDDDSDHCQWGEVGWTSDFISDHDGDGCRDATEDDDDDNDGYADDDDSCPSGVTDWISNASSDHDSDGCRDGTEDPDTDDDGVENHLDGCPYGSLSSEPYEDIDGDGCRDATEDDNDDNDALMDWEDDCPSGLVGWGDALLDYDSDGCHDFQEDADDDNDGVPDAQDSCPQGELGWSSSTELDWDGDGCKDGIEDEDDDNDGVPNSLDDCPYSESGWASAILSDWDGDGCRDSSEDTDDDNDGTPDELDDCPRGETHWFMSLSTDFDYDGCRDASEDADDDNDGVDDVVDQCHGPANTWSSNPANDHDGDGCNDSNDDDDIDNDGIADLDDPCPKSPAPGFDSDHDGDGCMDSEDEDDDDDGVDDAQDSCPTGLLGWTSTRSTDVDEDGCKDDTEDDEVDAGVLQWVKANTRLSAMLFLLAMTVLAMTSLRPMHKRRGKRRRKGPLVARRDPPPMGEPDEDDDLDMGLDSLESLTDGMPPLPPDPPKKAPAPPEKPPPPPPPGLAEEAPSEPGPEASGEDESDPVYWLNKAAEMAAAGRKDEAAACRKTAMSLMGGNS